MELVVAAGVFVEGALVDISFVDMLGMFVIAGAGGGVFVSAAGAVIVVELVIVESALWPHPARANGRLRARSARRE
jgi:hypothetical protein